MSGIIEGIKLDEEIPDEKMSGIIEGIKLDEQDNNNEVPPQKVEVPEELVNNNNQEGGQEIEPFMDETNGIRKHLIITYVNPKKNFTPESIVYDGEYMKGDNEELPGAVIRKEESFKEENIGYMENSVKGSLIQEPAGAAKTKNKQKFKEEEFNYMEDKAEGTNIQDTAGAAKRKKKDKFKEESFGYMDNKVEGTDNEGPGAAKRKKKDKFKEESFGYMDNKVEGTDNEGPGAAKRKKKDKFKEEEIGYMENINTNPKEEPKEASEEQKNPEEMDYFMDESISKEKRHRIKTKTREGIIEITPKEEDKKEEEETPDEKFSGIIEGIKNSGEYYEDGEIKGILGEKEEEGEEKEKDKEEEKEKEEEVPIKEFPVDDYQDEVYKENRHRISTLMLKKNNINNEESINYMSNKFEGDEENEGGVVDKKEESFKKQKLDYMEPKYEGDNIPLPGIVKTKEKKFKSESFNYYEGRNEGDEENLGGAVKKKKKNKFKEENVEYQDQEFNKEEMKEEEPEPEPEKLTEEQPDFIISGVISGKNAKPEEIVKAENADNNNYPIDYYLDEDENKRKHRIRFLPHHPIKNDKGENGEPDEFIEGYLRGFNDKSFNEEEYGYTDDYVDHNDKKNKKKNKKEKKKKFKEENVEYEEGEFNKEEEKKPEEEENEEPEKLNELQPDEIFSGVIPGLKANENEIEKAKEVNDYPDNYYIDEDENIDGHDLKTIVYNDNNYSGIIYGNQKNNDFIDNENSKIQEEENVNLSQIYVDYSNDLEEHYNFNEI
jgi:signal peptidase I